MPERWASLAAGQLQRLRPETGTRSLRRRTKTDRGRTCGVQLASLIGTDRTDTATSFNMTFLEEFLDDMASYPTKVVTVGGQHHPDTLTPANWAQAGKR